MRPSIRMIKLRMSWTGHVTRLGAKRNACRILMGKPEGKRRRGRRSVDGRIILRWILDRLVNTVMKLGLHKMLGNS
jgi:hypothetical protein